jgi:plasmid stabilization system protein ParE
VAARVEFLLPAREEVDEAFGWYLTRSTRAASGFLREIERELQLIAASPRIWPQFEAGTRRCPLAKYPYSIIYRESNLGVVVIAVAHDRRRPGYWQQR